MSRVTCEEALRLARGVEAEDLDSWSTLCKLAEFVEQLLESRRHAHRVNVRDDIVTVSDHAPKMDGSHVKLRMSARHARAMAADLLMAADTAEAEEERVMTDSIVQCDGCGAHGRRAVGCAAPDFWFYLESVDRTEGRPRDSIFVVWACSEACRDALWKRGPGHGLIDERGSHRMRERKAKP